MYEVYKNTVISGEADAAGITNTAYDGETKLGVDYFDGDELEDTNEVISRRLICDRCGYQIKSKAELSSQDGWKVCWRCKDEE